MGAKPELREPQSGAGDGPREPASGLTLAWWLVPGLLGAGLLGLGVRLVGAWQEYSVLGRAGVALLLVSGGLLLGAVLLAWVLLFLLRRFFRGMKRDMKTLGWQLGYMLRMGRPKR